MKPAPFEYHAPTTTAEVVTILAELGDEAKVLAGGQSLVPMLNLRLARFAHLVDIGRVTELRGIERLDGHVTIGAATRDVVIEHDELIARDVPLLAAATPYIGHFQIRNRGTLGGSLVHADPAAEYPAVAVALDATFRLASASGTRVVPATTFFTGVWSTALEADELLTAIDLPVWSGRCGFGVAEFARRHGDFAIAGAVAAAELDADGRIGRAAIAVFGAADVPVRATGAELALVGTAPGELSGAELGRLAFVGIDHVADDPQVPAAYRQRVGEAMVGDAWDQAIAAGPREVEMGEPVTVSLTVNGTSRRMVVEARKTLADALREDLALTGTHLGCEHGVCGACTVLIDGDAVRSCLMFAVQADGAAVVTVEGLAPLDGQLSDVQQAMHVCHGLQCGFCTPGFIVSITALLERDPDPDDEAIRHGLSGNLCRCTGYQGIIEAVRMAAGTRREVQS